MLEEFISRCERICGTSPAHCFITNKRQINCVTDMVINKVAGVQEMLAAALDPPPDTSTPELLEMAGENLRALLDWVRYLQVVQDLKELKAACIEGPPGRLDDRYPMPEAFRNYVRMEVEAENRLVQATLVEFSRHGVRFESAHPFVPGNLHVCSLSTSRSVTRELGFELRIKHCTPEDGQFIVGGRIEEVTSEHSFRVYKKLFDFILDMAKREPEGKSVQD